MSTNIPPSPLLFTSFWIFLFLSQQPPSWARASSFTRFLDHTPRRTTVGRTPLDEWSARRRGLYLTTHNTHNRQTSMLPVGFETTILSGERLQTYALDREATGTGFTIVTTIFTSTYSSRRRKSSCSSLTSVSSLACRCTFCLLFYCVILITVSFVDIPLCVLIYAIR